MTLSSIRRYVLSVRSPLLIALTAIALTFLELLGPFKPVEAAAAPLGVVSTYSVSIPAGATSYVSVRAIALQPGSNLPSGPLALATQPLAPDRLRIAVYYGLDWGYASINPEQVALAIWWLQDGTWRSTDHNTAQSIANAAATAPGIPSWNPDGRSLLTLAAQGQVIIGDLVLTPSATFPFIGDGTLAIHNTGSQDVTVYLPYGAVFGGASGQVVTWATGSTVPPPANATPTAFLPPTATPNQPPATATQAPVNTNTPQPAVPTAPYKNGLPPAATATPTDVVPAPAPPGQQGTPEPKGPPATVPPPATATSETVPPSPTAQPTDTPRPAATSTATAVPRNTPVPPPPATPSATHTAGPPPVTPSAVHAAGDAASAPQSPAKTGSDPKSVTGSKEAAPAPFTAVPSHTSTGDSVSAPPPVGTSVVQVPGAPSPVATQPGGLGTVPPAPQRTAGPPPITPTVPSPGLPTPTTPVNVGTTPTSLFVPPTTEPTRAVPATPTTNSAVDKATPVPVPVAPTAVPPTPAQQDNSGPPVINTVPDQTKVAQPGGGSGQGGTATGPKPTESPNTGAGPSQLPVWLSMISGLMVLAGWSLRKFSLSTRVAVPEAAGEENEQES